MKLFDISWPISPEMTGYKDKKEASFQEVKTFDDDGMRETKICLGSHAGTHVDAPSHFIKDGLSIDQMDLEQCVGKCHVLDMTHVKEKITADDLVDYDIMAHDILLFKTTNSNLTVTQAFDPYFVSLDESAAEYLAQKKIKAVGIDYLGIERGQPTHSTHTILFQAHITIIEGLRLGTVEAGIYLLVCLPLAIIGLEAAPARAILIKE